jgi:hypothetical protein
VVLTYHHQVLWDATLAHRGHIATAHFDNCPTLWRYLISYRVLIRFDAARITPYETVLHAYRFWPRMVPFNRLIEPWHLRKIEFRPRSRFGDSQQLQESRLPIKRPTVRPLAFSYQFRSHWFFDTLMRVCNLLHALRQWPHTTCGHGGRLVNEIGTSAVCLVKRSSSYDPPVSTCFESGVRMA